MKIVLSKTLSSKLKHLTGKIKIDNGDVETISYQVGNKVLNEISKLGYLSVKVDLSDHPNPEYDIEQCKKWMEIICKYFSTSYKAYRIDVGPFKGLFPIKVEHNEIHFQIEDYHYKESWRDWFIIEEENSFEITIPQKEVNNAPI